MTLVEVAVSIGILAILLGGILASLIQMRRLAAVSVSQNAALTIVQGYIEQLKNIPLQQFVNANPADAQNNPQLNVSFTLPTLKDTSTTVISLRTTPNTVPITTLTGATPGVTPTGVVDNLQAFDMDSRDVPGMDTWASIWPGANYALTAYPTTVPGKTDLAMNFWVRIEDLTPTSSAVCKAYGVVIVYTVRYRDGNRIRYKLESVRTIRSAVQTF
jgi:type II secretory pathway pseudopilin PulG